MTSRLPHSSGQVFLTTKGNAAYRFRLPTCIGVIILSDAMTFFWVWHFAKFHSRLYATEYFEAGVISLVYALVGVLVWLLVNQLRRDQTQLAHSVAELERTREQLVVQEKLEVVGRLWIHAGPHR